MWHIIQDNRKRIYIGRKDVFSLDAKETNDKIIKHEIFVWSNDVHFLFARDEKKILSALSEIFSLKPNQKRRNGKSRRCVRFVISKNVEVKGYGVGCQVVMYSADFSRREDIS